MFLDFCLMKRLRKILIIIRNYIKFQFNSRPKVYWCLIENADDPYSLVSENNFGDMLSEYITKKLTGKQPIYFDPNRVVGGKYIDYTCMVGSVLQFAGKNSTIWGSGVLSKDVDVKCKKILALRGKLSAQIVAQLGYEKVDAFGDPALLLPLLYNPNIEKKYKIGIAPNFVELDDILKLTIDMKDVLVINLMTKNIEDVINKILSCERIVSTSLHGIIVANAYNIPTVWAKYTNKLDGDDIKFHDYFSSVDLTEINPVNLNKREIDTIHSNEFFTLNPKSLIKVQRDLLRTFPYKIKNSIKNDLSL